jgi:hypothetical protein
MKLLAVGIGVAALLGYVTLSSKPDNETTMASAPSVVTASLPVAAFSGPFQRSAALCANEERYHCNMIIHDGTVKELVPPWSSFEQIKALNGWRGSEVTPDTPIPAGTKVVFMARNTNQ